VIAENGLISTMIQNRSMLREYKSLHKTQSLLRENISTILSLKLLKEQKLTQLSLKSKKLTAVFSGVKKGDEVSIEKLLKEKKLRYRSNFKDKSWYVEIEL